jgi:hypothetical protein
MVDFKQRRATTVQLELQCICHIYKALILIYYQNFEGINRNSKFGIASSSIDAKKLLIFLSEEAKTKKKIGKIGNLRDKE